MAGKKRVPATVKNTPMGKPRRLQQRHYSTLRLQKSIKHPSSVTLLSAPKIFIASLKLVKRHWKLFGSIVVIYGILNVLLVRGLSGGLNLVQLQDSLKELTQGNWSNLNSSFVIFGYLLGTATSTVSDVASTYQTFLVIYISLVTIWALRHAWNAKRVQVSQALYEGIAPLIQFILVLAVVFLQLIPFYIGSFAFQTVNTSGLAVTGVEKMVWGVLYAVLALFSLYMVTSSLFALYIVTLPGMRPVKALRSARNLVRYRRFTVLRKILFLPVILMVIAGAIFIPLIMVAPAVVEPLFFIASMVSIVLIHSYMYSLYKELLKT